MDLTDISSLRVIAGLESVGEHDMALDIAREFPQGEARAVADVITNQKCSSDDKTNELAQELIASVR